METNRLKQFCAIVETGSMVKASQLLHITHSALSKSMKLLQDEIGLSLLCSSGRGITPTENGLKIYHRAKEFLEHEHRLFVLEKNPKTPKLKIGAVEIFLVAIGEQLQRYSSTDNMITLLDLDPGNMEQLIANHKLDYGITYAPFPTEKVEIIEIGKYRLGCYLLKGSFSGMDISEIPFVTPALSLSSNPLGIKERDGWVESIYPRNRKYAVNLLSTAMQLTLQGLCAIYIPHFVAKIHNSRKTNGVLVEYPLAKNQRHMQSAFLLRHKDRENDLTFKQLCQMIHRTISPKTS